MFIKLKFKVVHEDNNNLIGIETLSSDFALNTQWTCVRLENETPISEKGLIYFGDERDGKLLRYLYSGLIDADENMEIYEGDKVAVYENDNLLLEGRIISVFHGLYWSLQDMENKFRIDHTKHAVKLTEITEHHRLVKKLNELGTIREISSIVKETPRPLHID